MNNKYLLTEGSVLKKLLLFTIPIFGANLLQALYGTVDLLIVGKFADAAAVSAVSTGSITMSTLTGITAGFTMGSTVLLGQNIGARDTRTATRTVFSSLVLFIVAGLIMMVLIPAAAPPIARVMNAPEEAFSYTVEYIRICGFGMISIVLFNAFSGMFRGVGDSGTPLVLVGISCAINIVGDYILVGVLHMGASGAAVATVGAQAVSVLTSFVILWKKGMGFSFEQGEKRPAVKEILQILKYGTPIAAQEALTGVSFLIILAILNSFGLIASAGVGIAEKICSLIFIVPVAIMSALSAFAAQNIGAGRRDRAHRGLYVGMAVSVGMGVIMFFLGYFRGVWLSSLFSGDYEVCLASADYLRSYSIDCILVGFNFSMMGYLNGCGRTGFVALQGILSTFLVRIPVSWFMSKIPGVSLFQVGFATPLASLFAILITVWYIRRMERKLQREQGAQSDLVC